MKVLLFISLALLPPALYGQEKKDKAYIDSLLQELPKAQNDTNKVKLLGMLSFAYSTADPGEGLKYAHAAEELSAALEWKKGLASSYAELGINYAAKSDNTKAIYYDLKALELYKELDDRNSEAAMFANISLVYTAQSNYSKALDYAFRALRKDGHIDRATEAIILENIGTIYLEQKNYPQTIEYYANALKAYEEIGDRMGVARNLGNSGIVEDAKGNYEKSLSYHFKALNANQEQGNINGVQINLANIGYVYSHLHDYTKALEYQFKALKISEGIGRSSSIAINLGNIGETYYTIATDTSGAIKHALVSSGKMASLAQSIKYLEKAINICKEINYAGPQVEFSKYLSDAMLLAGDYKRSLEVYKEYTAVKDSVFSQHSKVELSNLETQRALDLKDKEIIIKNKEIEIRKLGAANNLKERGIYISGIVLLLVIAGLAIRKFMKRSKVQKTVLSEIAHFQSHEVRGPVARILGLVQLFNQQEPHSQLNKDLIAYIVTEAQSLDEITRKVVMKSTDKAATG